MVNLLKNDPTSTIDVLTTWVNADNADPFSDEEINLMLEQLESEDKIMYRDGQIFLT